MTLPQDRTAQGASILAGRFAHAEDLDQSPGSEDFLELGLPLLPFALENAHANYVVRTIASYDVASQMPFLHKTECLVHPQDAAIEGQNRTADLVEPQLRKNILKRKVFGKHAHVLSAHVGSDYIEAVLTPPVARIDVV